MPQLPAFREHPGDWLLNNTIFAQAIQAIEKRIKVDRTKTIPYVAGYNATGKTIYIDYRMPKGFKYNGREVLTDQFLILHEVIEVGLINQFPGLPYQLCHQIALRVEKDAVIAANVDWNAYNAFTDKWVKVIGKAPAHDVPEDLSLKPEIDEKDFKELHKMSYGN